MFVSLVNFWDSPRTYNFRKLRRNPSIILQRKKIEAIVTIQLLLLLILLLRTASSSSDELALQEIAKKNCAPHCGGVRIPYPFVVALNNHCYFDKWYEIECHNNISVRKAKPFLRHL